MSGGCSPLSAPKLHVMAVLLAMWEAALCGHLMAHRLNMVKATSGRLLSQIHYASHQLSCHHMLWVCGHSPGDLLCGVHLPVLGSLR